MNDRSYTKLFSSIVTSSMWCEDSDTRVVWVTMLALASSNGEVSASIPGLARTANVSVDACRSAIHKFESPDPDSRTPENEGRRIEKIQGGWRLLNHALYRRMMSEEERKEYKREWDKRNRGNRPNSANRQDTPDNPRQNPTNPIHKEAEEEAKAKADAKADKDTSLFPSSIKKKRRPESFEEFMLFCAKSGISEKDGRYFYDLKEDNLWTNSGKPVNNWQATLLRWKREGWLPSQKFGSQKQEVSDENLTPAQRQTRALLASTH